MSHALDEYRRKRNFDRTPEPEPAEPRADEPFIAPQLATLVDRPPAGDQWLHEIKYDGYRMLIHIRRGKVQILSRNAKDWTQAFDPLIPAFKALGVKEALLDGEVVMIEPDGRTDFQALQNMMREDASRLTFMAFDLLSLDGEDLRGLSVDDRKAKLADLLAREDRPSTVVRYSDHVVGNGAAFFARACSAGLEGIISKRREAPYRSGRGRDWLKIKCLARQELVVGGWSPPSGARQAFGSLLLGAYDDQHRLIYVGRVGTGFNAATLAEILEKLERLETRAPPFANPPRERGLRWVRPELVAEVKFHSWTQDRILRQPSFLGLREDKLASEVGFERPAKEPGSRKRTSPRRAKGMLLAGETEALGVRLTHPDRVLYPEDSITKQKIAEYYAKVAGRMLPEAGDRPLSLFRCPEGREGGCFYQKHSRAGVPDVVRRIDIEESDKKSIYLWVDSPQGLIGLVQINALELHIWGSRVDRLEQPDRIVFDLDPAADLRWPRMVEAAAELRERLEDLGLLSFLKTTGGKGLHVVVPIARRSSWEDVRSFSAGVAEAMVADSPERYTAKASLSQRPGKVFIDYLRNSRGATSIAPYSLRRHAHAPVAMPIAWEDLGPDLRPDQFHLDEVLAELDSGAADPWGEISSVRQSITAAMRRKVSRRP